VSTESSSFDVVEPLGGYQVELLLRAADALKVEVFTETLGKLDAEATVELRGTTLGVTFPGGTKSTVLIELPQAGALEPETVSSAASQTWDWPGVQHALNHVGAAAVVREASAKPITDRFERLRRINIVLRALVEHLPVVALHWLPSQRLLDPSFFIASLSHGGSVMDHAVNVRLFNVPDGRPGEKLMDTVGLNYFGIADLQCHFMGLDPSDVAPILAHYAEYVFEKGDVLQDDDLVRGVESYDEWAVHREASLAQPNRVVVDIRADKHGVRH
jgi:hypothetical protein